MQPACINLMLPLYCISNKEAGQFRSNTIYMADTKSKKCKKVKSVVALEPVSNDLAVMMKSETEKRKLLTEYISKHMVAGVDYGTIKFGGKESKPSLFKPGSEKYLSLFRFVAFFIKDTDTWEMAGKVDGLFCYLCQIKNSKGEVVGEGRGAANLKEKAGWTVNNAVKIAEKRAQIDAVLRTGGLSDFFTQDLEDMVASYDNSPVDEKAVPVVTYDDPENVQDDRGPSYKIETPTDVVSQRKKIFAILRDEGVDVTDLKACRTWVADNTELELVESNFAAIIKKLTK